MKRRTLPNTDPQPGIPARYNTDCPRCDDPIRRGDRIIFSKGRPIHVRCASGQDDDE